MTLPNLPKRSSSDDTLDQALNAWSMGEYPDTANSLADEALEFHRWADETRYTDPAATGPAAGTWNRVLRSTVQTSSRGGDMGSVTMSTEPQSTIVNDSRPYNRREPGHYLNLVATLAIVFAVTVGGWFAMSQLPPGDGDGRFAALQGTPGVAQATCDVNPMTVDEVIAIVENPYSAYNPEDIFSRDWLRIWEENSAHNLVELYSPAIDQHLLDSFTYLASNSSFDDAVSRANGFLACSQTGTIGHVFVYMEPREVQRIVLVNHPVYRDKAAVRATVEELIAMPALEIVFPGRNTLHGTDLSLSVNPEIESALVAQGTAASRYEATRVVMMGIVATDEEGTVVYQSNAEGIASPEAGLDRTSRFRLIMKQSSIDGRWYVLATWPEILHVR